MSALFTASWLLLMRVHGHIALLGLALLLHPVLGLRRARRITPRVWLSAVLATTSLALMNTLGWVLYPEYRMQVRATLYRADRALGLAFEVKEHVAFFALCLGIAGLGIAWCARRLPPKAQGQGAQLEPSFWISAVRQTYLAAFLLSLLSAVLGILLASLYTFPTVLK